MTIKEISNLTGCSIETVRIKGKLLFPNKFAKGKKTRFNQRESFDIVNDLRKKGFIHPTENMEVLAENKDVITRNDLKEFAKEIIQETIKAIIPVIQNNQQYRQIEIKQDYFSILAYCNIKQIELTFSDAIKHGKEASKLSNQLNIEIRQIPDERFGKVNSYHISILEKIFEI